jgi:sugar phosphate isomerase/epimerase
MVLLAFATLNHCPLVLKGVSLPDQFAAAADAGFTFVSPDIFSLRAWRDTGQTYDQFADALAASGLECYDIAGLNISGSDEATQAEADEMLPFATALGIEWMEARVTVPVDDGVRDRFSRICEQYGAHGVGVAIEYSPYTPLDWMGDATALARHGRNFAQTGIIIDTWHFFHGRDDWPDIDALDLADFAFVQFSDGPAPDGSGALPDTMNLRSVPGEGELDLTAFADRLRGKGWNGVVALEVLSAADREDSVADFARRCYDATLPYWE